MRAGAVYASNFTGISAPIRHFRNSSSLSILFGKQAFIESKFLACALYQSKEHGIQKLGNRIFS